MISVSCAIYIIKFRYYVVMSGTSFGPVACRPVAVLCRLSVSRDAVLSCWYPGETCIHPCAWSPMGEGGDPALASVSMRRICEVFCLSLGCQNEL